MALRLAALCFLFPTIANSYPLGGKTPNIKLYYSLNQKTKIFILRGVELKSALTDEPVYPCDFNNSSGKDYCATQFTCGTGVNGDINDPATIHFGYRATDRQIYNAMLAKVGQEIKVFIGGRCLDSETTGRPGETMKIMTTAVSTPAPPGSGGGGSPPLLSQVWGDGSTEKVPDEPDIDPGCTVNDTSSSKVEIRYGTVLSDTAHNLEQSAQIKLNCKADAFMKLSVPNDQVPLRADGSLSTQIHFSKPSNPEKIPGALGIFTKILSKESTFINVVSTLKVQGELEGGPFNGSTVINLEYY